MSSEEKWKVLRAKLGKETVYFKDSFEDAVFKAVPHDGVYVKLRGEEEFKAKEGSKLVTEAKLAHEAITAKEYEDFT